mmetsp:Transcript_16100/g.50502  ORF Transcript_16100/g.50502 Transcript_16100/m.50502 type:complete len:320 (+) Transcript_16100:623-1582(+)
MPFLTGRLSSCSSRRSSARSISKRLVSRASQRALRRCRVPLWRPWARASPSASRGRGTKGPGAPGASGGGAPGSWARSCRASASGQSLNSGLAGPPPQARCVLPQPLRGPLPVSRRKWRRPPSRASSSTRAPTERRSASARDDGRFPRLTSRPDSPCKPVTSQSRVLGVGVPSARSSSSASKASSSFAHAGVRCHAVARARQRCSASSPASAGLCARCQPAGCRPGASGAQESRPRARSPSAQALGPVLAVVLPASPSAASSASKSNCRLAGRGVGCRRSHGFRSPMPPAACREPQACTALHEALRPDCVSAVMRALAA